MGPTATPYKPRRLPLLSLLLSLLLLVLLLHLHLHLANALNYRVAGFALPTRENPGITAPTLYTSWDTWSFVRDPEQDTGLAFAYYEFYLASPFLGFGVLTSDDGVHWADHGLLLTMDPGMTWLGTGSVWRAPDFAASGEYVVNFSQFNATLNEQKIFFARSTNLLAWTRVSGDIFQTNTSLYQGPGGRWDCIYTVPAPAAAGLAPNARLGYWTAKPLAATGGAWGYGFTEDGVTWTALPPPAGPGGELGAVETFALPGGQTRYVCTVGQGLVGTVTDRPGGPFQAQTRNPNHMSGCSAYFARFLRHPTDGVLVTHQFINKPMGSCFIPPLKLVEIDANNTGTLRLRWWPGNAAMLGGGGAAFSPGPLTPRQVAFGLVFEAALRMPLASPAGLAVHAADNETYAILLASASTAADRSVPAPGEPRLDSGPTVDPAVRIVRLSDGANLTAASRDLAFAGASMPLRVLLRYNMVEVYAAPDYLLVSFALPAAAVGLALAGTTSAVQAATLAPLNASQPNLAWGVPAVASSSYPGNYSAALAVDGNFGTRWSSGLPYGPPATLDLNINASFRTVDLFWQDQVAYARTYALLVANTTRRETPGAPPPAAAWTEVYRTTGGTGNHEQIVLAAPDQAPLTADWLRIFCQVKGEPPASFAAFSLWEVQVQ